MEGHREFQALNCTTALRTGSGVLYVRLFVQTPVLMIEAISYTPPVTSRELLGSDQKSKYLFSVSCCCFDLGASSGGSFCASRRVIHPCDCLMKHPTKRLCLTKTGNIEVAHFANWARRHRFQAVNIAILSKIAYCCNCLSPYCFFFSFHRKN